MEICNLFVAQIFLFFCSSVFPQLNGVISNSVPEIIFWHIPSKAYKEVAPMFRIHKPCVGSINKEKVASQEAEMGIMKLLVERPSVKVRILIRYNHTSEHSCKEFLKNIYNLYLYIHVQMTSNGLTPNFDLTWSEQMSWASSLLSHD